MMLYKNRGGKMLEELVAEFTENEISYDFPGFYDHPNFLRKEAQDPQFLFKYGYYVRNRIYDEQYKDRVRNELPTIAAILHNELVRDGRVGACVDVSISFSRILDREGIWNCIAKGSVYLEFIARNDIEPIGLHHFDFNQEKTGISPFPGHAWLFVPPYNIVDITISQQPYSVDIINQMPNYIMTEDTNETDAVSRHIIHNELAAAMRLARATPAEILERFGLPNVPSIIRPEVFETRSCRATYTTCEIGASDGTLEETTSLCLSNRYPIKIYEEDIVPALAELRAKKSTNGLAKLGD